MLHCAGDGSCVRTVVRHKVTLWEAFHHSVPALVVTFFSRRNCVVLRIEIEDVELGVDLWELRLRVGLMSFLQQICLGRLHVLGYICARVVVVIVAHQARHAEANLV